MYVTLSSFHLYLRIQYLKLNKNLFKYQYYVCRHSSYSQISPQMSNKIILFLLPIQSIPMYVLRKEQNRLGGVGRAGVGVLGQTY